MDMESLAEYKASVAMWQYCAPVLFAFGTFGNTMTVVIIHRQKRKHSAMPMYLTALAVSDTCQLLTGLLRGWIMSVFQVDVRTLHSVTCKVHVWLVYSSIIVSSWLLCYMTMERTVSVWLPHRVSLLCSRSKAIVIIVVTVVMSLLVNGHLPLWLDIVVKNDTSKECLTPNEEYMIFIYDVWNWVDLTLSSLLPFTFVTLGNLLIVWKVSLSVRTARNMSSSRLQDVSHRQRKTSSMTVTLMALSVIFFITTSPICVYNIIEPYVVEKIQDDFQGIAQMRLAWAVVNILMYTNSTVNFYLYCLSGASFRRELKRCLCCHLRSSSSPSKNPDVATITNQSQPHADSVSIPVPLTVRHHSVPGIGDKKLDRKTKTSNCVLLSVQTLNSESCSEF
ncbi:hypothetical protein ACOMHN_006433 [Nucella lapillus]